MGRWKMADKRKLLQVPSHVLSAMPRCVQHTHVVDELKQVGPDTQLFQCLVDNNQFPGHYSVDVCSAYKDKGDLEVAEIFRSPLGARDAPHRDGENAGTENAPICILTHIPGTDLRE